MVVAIVDERLKDWATPRQAEMIDAVNRLGGMTAAAREMGIASPANITDVVRMLKKKAARDGYAPGNWENGVAAGYRMGKVTVQRDAFGKVLQTWERQSPAAEAVEALARDLAAGLAEQMPRAAAVAPPAHEDEDLLTVYPQGDPHAGLRSWKDETGSHFDLVEFERVQVAAVDRLVASTPPSAIAIFNDKGDSTHADNSKNRTPRSGHQLDVDGRHAEVVRVAARVKRHQIGRMLEKHRKVIVRIDPGNHDPETALMLALLFEAIYENEPRVEVITSPNPYWYYRFGANLIGTCHGDGAKGKDLPGIMAHDARAWWGEATNCVWFVGHVHHKDIKEYTGCTVEYCRTLAAPDAYSNGAGYRSKRDLQAITFHKTDGEVERHTCSLERLNRLMSAPDGG
ncbi:MAG: hypothetical protein KA105_02890 [Caulobacter sp.]|nr:hypothetical protein [Caulobacter sp.]